MRSARRRRVATVSAVAFGLALAAACGFPDVSFAPSTEGDGGGPESSSTTDGPAMTDNDAALDATDETPLLIDGSDPDALISHDSGGAPIDAAACGPTVCDCDHDTYNEIGKSGCNTGENDCDDKDPRAHPGQKFLEDKVSAPLFGDWDCNGTIEPLYKTGVSCAGLTLGLGCDGIFGFSDAPACGETGTWIRCTQGILSCAVGTTTSLVQPCR